MDERLWLTPEIHNVLAALCAAHDALPWPARWLMRDWKRALATLGVTINTMSDLPPGLRKIWDAEGLTFVITALGQAKGCKIWNKALAAALHAFLGDDVPWPVELDKEVWGEQEA